MNIQIRSSYRQLDDGELTRDDGEPTLRPAIRRALVVAARAEGVPRESSVGVLVCDDATMREYNRRFAGVDAATDVLAFPAHEAAGGASLLPDIATQIGEIGDSVELGDIILCLDLVRVQAARAKHPIEEEAATLVIHGFLHLLGYDHGDRAQKRKMYRRTAEILDLR